MGENSKKVTKSADQTKAYGKSLAKTLQGGCIVALYGDLGSGKTTFVQGLAQGLGVTQRIVSPTFLIMRSYALEFKILPMKGILEKNSKFKNTSKNSKVLYHIDLYRIQDEKDVEGLGLQELMQDQNNIVVIEWPEKMEKLLPKHTKRMYFKYRNDTEREITGNFNLSS